MTLESGGTQLAGTEGGAGPKETPKETTAETGPTADPTASPEPPQTPNDPADDPIDNYGSLRERVRTAMKADGITHRQLASESGLKPGTSSSFLGGTYTGRKAPVAEALENWLRTRAERTRLQTVAAAGPGFVETPTALRFLDVLIFAQSMSEIVVVAAEPGLGKSVALRHYCDTHVGAWYLMVEPHMVTLPQMIAAVAKTVGVQASYPTRRLEMLEDSLSAGRGLIVIDEAQNLSLQQLNQLKAWNELMGVGIALFGNRHIHTRLEGAKREAAYAQLYSRIALRLNLKKPRTGDISALLDAWGVDGKAERALLEAAAKKPGALRNMDKTLKLATMVAGGRGRPLDTDMIRTAWQQISSIES